MLYQDGAGWEHASRDRLGPRLANTVSHLKPLQSLLRHFSLPSFDALYDGRGIA